MKHLILAMLLASGTLVLGQADSQDPYSEKLVAAFVTTHAPIISMQEKAVNRLGDRAAIGLIRHMSTAVPANPQEVGQILSVIKMAYAAPQAIGSDADREPKATLLLLAYLNLLANAGDTKAEVENTRAYVVRQITEYKSKESGAKTPEPAK